MNFSDEIIEKRIIKNFGTVIAGLRIKSNKLVSDTVEELYAEYVKGKAINATGYDAICKENYKHEIKFTDSLLKNKTLRIGNLASKKGKCDFIVIIDGINNLTSIIPTKVFFKRANILTSGSKGEFFWDSEYSGRQKNNTKLFLDYVVHKSFKVN